MSASPVPEWAAFFSPERFDIYFERVEKWLDGLGRPYMISREDGSYRLYEGTSARVYGLVNLAQVCNQTPLDDWDSVIASFLGQLANQNEAEELPKDFEEVRPILRVRMFANESLEPGALVKLPVADEFMTCLAVDLPDKVVTVNRDQAVIYRLGSEELFRIALENVRTKVEFEREEIPATDLASITVFQGNDYFVASLALVLDEIEGPAPELGRFVAVPNRHVAMTAPIVDAASMAVLGLMVHAARGMFRDGPGSITPYVFWVHGGRWTRLDIELSEEGVGVQGPESFIETVLDPLLGDD